MTYKNAVQCLNRRLNWLLEKENNYDHCKSENAFDRIRAEIRATQMAIIALNEKGGSAVLIMKHIVPGTNCIIGPETAKSLTTLP